MVKKHKVIKAERITLKHFNDGTQYCPNGKCTFNVVLEREDADKLSKEGWNVKYYAAELDDDDPMKKGEYIYGKTNLDAIEGEIMFTLGCKILYRDKNGHEVAVKPKIYMSADGDMKPVMLDENTVKDLNRLRVESVVLSDCNPDAARRPNVFVNEGVFNISTKPFVHKSRLSELGYDIGEENI